MLMTMTHHHGGMRAMTEEKWCSTEERPMCVLRAQRCNENKLAVAAEGTAVMKGDLIRQSFMALQIWRYSWILKNKCVKEFIQCNYITLSYKIFLKPQSFSGNRKLRFYWIQWLAIIFTKHTSKLCPGHSFTTYFSLLHFRRSTRLIFLPYPFKSPKQSK